ncbi:hypothetical protein FB005_114155 [Sinorhizobium medicae]|nr:hypothetical protein FB006_11420 [Sinorhizobium medicae]TWA40025.1 hypothetical protein FB005_114155 [Sinorhizobium medicae]
MRLPLRGKISSRFRKREPHLRRLQITACGHIRRQYIRRTSGTPCRPLGPSRLSPQNSQQLRCRTATRDRQTVRARRRAFRSELSCAGHPAKHRCQTAVRPRHTGQIQGLSDLIVQPKVHGRMGGWFHRLGDDICIQDDHLNLIGSAGDLSRTSSNTAKSSLVSPSRLPTPAKASPMRTRCSGLTALSRMSRTSASVLRPCIAARTRKARCTSSGTFRTVRMALGVPLLREGSPIGVLALSRSTVRPVTGKQVELASTFADPGSDRDRKRTFVPGGAGKNRGAVAITQGSEDGAG